MKTLKVFLFGSNTIGAIPAEVENHLKAIIEQSNGNVEFIVGDCDGVDSAFHMVLSRIGARSKSKIYCMDFARSKKFEIETVVFNGTNEEGERLVGRELYEIKDKHMIEDCDFAIAVWDKKTKGTFNNITSLKVRNKPVYVYTLDI